MLPLAAQLLRNALSDPHASVPSIGSFYVVGIVVCVLLGIIAGFAFRPHNILAALYHGATAPITFAFIAGINVHP